MRIFVLNQVPDDRNLGCQWNELVQQMEQPQVFYTYEWALAVYRAYGATVTPHLLLATDEGSLVGVAALATDGSRRHTGFLAETTSDYCDFVSAPERREEFVERVFAELRRLNLPTLTLANLPADSTTARVLKRGARDHGYRFFCREAYACARVTLGSGLERHSIAEALRKKKKLRRYMDAMGKIAAVRVSHLRAGEDIAAVLPDFFQAHVSRFLATGRTSNLVRVERRNFLTELTKLLSAKGWVTMSQLWVGDRPVASNFGFQFSGSWFWYLPTFETNLQQYSPGHCLVSKIVEEACHNPEIDCVDLGLGAEGYKERLANSVRNTLHITATVSAPVLIKTALRHHTVAAIKSVPHAEGWVRGAVARAGEVRGLLSDNGVGRSLHLLWKRYSHGLAGVAR